MRYDFNQQQKGVNQQRTQKEKKSSKNGKKR